MALTFLGLFHQNFFAGNHLIVKIWSNKKMCTYILYCIVYWGNLKKLSNFPDNEILLIGKTLCVFHKVKKRVSILQREFEVDQDKGNMVQDGSFGNKWNHVVLRVFRIFLALADLVNISKRGGTVFWGLADSFSQIAIIFLIE